MDTPLTRGVSHTTRRRSPDEVRLRGQVSSRRRGQLALGLIVLFLTSPLCSCVDLTSVTQFAKSSQDVGNSFKSIADDTLATCNWAHDFFPAGENPLDCATYQKIEPKLTALNDILFAYIASLGKLAAPISSTNPFGNSASDIKNADPSFTTDEQTLTKASAGLFGAISQLVMGAYQQHQLTHIIRDHNDAVQIVVGVLSGYAADRSALMVRNTWTLEHEFCVAQPQTNKGEPLAAKLLSNKCSDDSVRKDEMLNAIGKYQAALKVIADTHAKLADPKTNWTTKNLVEYLGPQMSQLSAAALSMRQALK